MTEKTLNTLESLLAGVQAAADTIKPTELPVAELGGTVFVRPMSADEWLDQEQPSVAKDASACVKRGWHIGRWLCNEQGERLIHPGNTAALEVVAKLPWEVAHRILVAAGVMESADQKNA
jgi:hypothetical protein